VGAERAYRFHQVDVFDGTLRISKEERADG
jgi:hypothetical protein